MIRRRFVRGPLVLLALSLGALTANASWLRPSSTHNSSPAQSARLTLSDMRDLATGAARNAEEVQTMIVNTQTSVQSEQARLMDLKQDINDIGRDLASLEANRASLSPWERQALERVLPLMKEAAANAQKAIEFSNAHPSRLWSPEDRAYADHIAKDLSRARAILGDYLKSDKLRKQQAQLRRRISEEVGGA